MNICKIDKAFDSWSAESPKPLIVGKKWHIALAFSSWKVAPPKPLKMKGKITKAFNSWNVELPKPF